ncbi:hypothetical protein GDO86_012279 [Hymenochirus boettgeri]|uniref:Uncharacterized protein n=1 Tax=Hymenochirus boettgeri TaxID=247094 RepID=A0A8T2IQK7_9PIPI|nr:hypothetical protein GDO86_012279 [Hymenochirus boettgeri]
MTFLKIHPGFRRKPFVTVTKERRGTRGSKSKGMPLNRNNESRQEKPVSIQGPWTQLCRFRPKISHDY